MAEILPDRIFVFISRWPMPQTGLAVPKSNDKQRSKDGHRLYRSKPPNTIVEWTQAGPGPFPDSYSVMSVSVGAVSGLVLLVLVVWKYSTGRIEYEHIASRRNEIYYWVTILVPNTLGTALGDFTATSLGLGFERRALVFSALIALVAVLHFTTEPRGYLCSRLVMYSLVRWAGDTLTKSHQEGGLGLGRIWSSLVILAAMMILVALTSRAAQIQRGAKRTVTDFAT